MLKLYNSLSKKVEEFLPIKPGEVGMYACGPTVYDFSHIGHGRKYVNDDVLRRVLENIEGCEVTHVQNITDVGHLVSDADEGEDKLEMGAKKYGKTVWEVAKEYTDFFFKEMDMLNILRPSISCKATDHITEQIELIKILVGKGYAYETPEAIYFELARFEDYGKLFGQNLDDKLEGARDEVVTENSKKNPADFALWFKRVGKYVDHVMYWPSPWGDGFPGWHIECSAMSMKYLGDQIDIHTGGEDHLSIHHPNEIAQSEAATGKKFVNYWFHSAFLMVDGKKMSKSLGNVYKVADIIEKGFSPTALRYYYLTTHYRKTMNFTWEGLEAASNAYLKLRRDFRNLEFNVDDDVDVFRQDNNLGSQALSFRNQFVMAVEDDLNMPNALAVAWDLLKNRNVKDWEKRILLKNFDKISGLFLGSKEKKVELPEEITEMMKQREKFRKDKMWAESDDMRKKIEELGYKVSDFADGVKVEKTQP